VAQPVAEMLEELEAALGAALARAEEAARHHPPFVAALSQDAELAQAPSLRTLDVGCIRVDGSELWPDEARELDLEPMLAPFDLTALVLDWAGEAAVKHGGPPQPEAKAASAGDALAGLLAFAKSIKGMRSDGDT